MGPVNDHDVSGSRLDERYLIYGNRRSAKRRRGHRTRDEQRQRPEEVSKVDSFMSKCCLERDRETLRAYTEVGGTRLSPWLLGPCVRLLLVRVGHWPLKDTSTGKPPIIVVGKDTPQRLLYTPKLQHCRNFSIVMLSMYRGVLCTHAPSPPPKNLRAQSSGHRPSYHALCAFINHRYVPPPPPPPSPPPPPR